MPVFLLFGSCPVLPMGHQCLMAIYKRHSTKYNKYITALCPCRWCQTSRKLALASPFSRVILDSKCVGVKVFLKLRKLSDFTPVISQVYLKTTNLYILLYIYIYSNLFSRASPHRWMLRRHFLRLELKLGWTQKFEKARHFEYTPSKE